MKRFINWYKEDGPIGSISNKQVFWFTIISFFAIGISACTEPNVKKKRTNIVINRGDDRLEVVEIEGCEYFKCAQPHAHYTLAHKGNCNNRIHKEHTRR